MAMSLMVYDFLKGHRLTQMNTDFPFFSFLSVPICVYLCSLSQPSFSMPMISSAQRMASAAIDTASSYSPLTTGSGRPG